MTSALSSVPTPSLVSFIRWAIPSASTTRNSLSTTVPIAIINSSISAIFVTGFSAAVSPSLASIPKNANWWASSKTPVHVGIYLPAWSTITTSAPIPPASPSLTVSMICSPIEAPSWSAGLVKAVTESLRYGLIPNSSVNGIRCRYQWRRLRLTCPLQARQGRRVLQGAAGIAGPQGGVEPFGACRSKGRARRPVYHFVYHCNREGPLGDVTTLSGQKTNPLI